MQELSNGAGPPGPGTGENPGELREHIAQQARELLAQEQRRVERLTAELAAAKALRDQARKVLEVMLMVPGESKAPKAKASATKPWNVSEDTVTKVLEAIRQETEPITQTQLAQKIKVGGDTIRKAMHTLRERELVRITGSTRGGGKLYLPMPELVLNKDSALVGALVQEDGRGAA